MQWFGITSVVMIATYTLANLIPFFDDFVELVGSMLSPFLAFLFPCIFLPQDDEDELDHDRKV